MFECGHSYSRHTYLRIWGDAEQKVTTLLGALQYLVLVHVVGGSYKLRHLLAQE